MPAFGNYHNLASPGRFATAAMCLLFLAGCQEQTPEPRSSSVKGVAVTPQQTENAAVEAFHLVNEERIRRGLVPLQRRRDLDAVAYAHALDLLGMNKLSHISSNGRHLEDRLASQQWVWAGENLARNKGFESPAAEAVRGWIASPRHYENMFRPNFSQAGMASIFDPDTGFTYFVQVFIIPVV